MKNTLIRKLCLSISVASLIMCGCGKEIPTESTAEASVDNSQEEQVVAEAKEESTEAATVEESKTEAEEKVEEKEEETVQEEVKEEEQERPDTEVPKDSTYYAFTVNEAKATFGDENTYRIIGKEECFSTGVEYTLDEIVSGIQSSLISYDESQKAIISSWMIDCGEDGNREMMVEIELPGSPYDELAKNLIVKEVDGKLEIRYYKESSLRDEETVNLWGVVSPAGAASYDVWGGEYGILDSEMKWHFYYVMYYYLDMSAYSSRGNHNGLSFDYSASEWRNVQVEEYSFDEDRSNRTYYTVYYDTNDEGIVDDDSIYEDGSTFKKAFDDSGIDTCTPDEIKKLLEDHKPGH